MPDGPRYDDDFYAWTQYQAEVLRTLRTRDNRFDREHVAEEIEDLGKSERDAVRSQITPHPRAFPEARLFASPIGRATAGWGRSSMRAVSLDDKLTPTLRRECRESFAAALSAMRATARTSSLREHGRTWRCGGAAGRLSATPLTRCSHDDWYPEPPAETK